MTQSAQGARPKTSSVPARVGQLIGGRYELQALLGVGGMGAVYAAQHAITHRSVALKLVSASTVRERPTVERRLLREAAVVGTMQHPGIVEILDAGKESDGSIYLVFELLEGEDLERALLGGRVRPKELVQIAIRALEALTTVHGAGYVHRDVKPANLYLVGGAPRPTQVKLIDFGITCPIKGPARPGDTVEIPRVEVDPITEQGTVVGTIEYMSPEQALGDGIEPRSDLWSVGAVLFRGLTGRPPFSASNPTRLIVKAATETAPPLAELRPDLPDALCAVVDRALARDVRQRPKDAREMMELLQGCAHARLDRAPAPAVQSAAVAPWGLSTDDGLTAGDRTPRRVGRARFVEHA